MRFTYLRFSHTHRLGNSLAHNLAQYVRHIDALIVWIEDAPPELHHVLVTDFGWFNKVSSRSWFSKEKKKSLLTQFSRLMFLWGLGDINGRHIYS